MIMIAILGVFTHYRVKIAAKKAEEMEKQKKVSEKLKTPNHSRNSLKKEVAETFYNDNPDIPEVYIIKL
uniref:Uncharacterized protein n=1 Tax=Panagrolaimus davidi TaxID=227884 RepID=A0A914R266_9BILA